jgi:hypothetical protein
MRPLLAVLALLAVARAEDKIQVERTAEALVVCSPPDQANFLFRAPASFKELPPAEPFRLDLGARKEGASARVRLKISTMGAADATKNPATLAREREKEYREGYPGDFAISGEGARRLVRVEGKQGCRRILLVRDGDRLYELFLDDSPAGSAFAAALDRIAAGFTILEPKGAPAEVRLTPEELKAKMVEHEYYRLKVLKPAGFVQEEVDPDKERGIWLHLRRKDQVGNLCEIKVRVFLARAVRLTTEEKAGKAIERFVNRYADARAPKKPKRTGWRDAKHAFRANMVGKWGKTGLVVHEDYLIVDHNNGRLYEFQVTMWAGQSASSARRSPPSGRS